RTGLRTIAYGSGLTTRMRLNDLPMNVDLEPGDLLVTSGLGGTFPAGLPVARVDEIERPSGEAFASATLRPLGRLDRSRHLLVLDPVEPPAPDPVDPVDPVDPDAAADALESQPADSVLAPVDPEPDS
ncbi:MAG: rod shape-determining protein MreC, partial [Wenzhouxiangella sp.]